VAASRTQVTLAIALAVIAAILLPVAIYVRHTRDRGDATPTTTQSGSAIARDPWANPDEPLPPRYAPRPVDPIPTPPPAPPPAPDDTDDDLVDPFASRSPTGSAAACGVDCECEDGTKSHSVQIVNGRCVDDATACTRTCEAHDGVKGTWDPRRGKRVGESCNYAAQCAQKICNHGLCSRACKWFSDCPLGWECDRPSAGDEGECRKR
jgi:hypothetical protein